MSNKCTLLLAILLLLQNTAAADLLLLPNQLSQINEEAFYGDESIVECVIPESVVSIDDRAFAYCKNLGWITIPGSTESLGEDVFTGCADDLLICTEAGSEACNYARRYSIDYQAGTTYRALLIGQTYSQNEKLKLSGPENDVCAIEKSLTSYPGTPYNVIIQMDVSAEDLLNAINKAFGSATVNDVSLFYYSGHGVSSSDTEMRGALLGIDGTDCVSVNQLRNALDQITGRKIVIIDACYSGAMLASNKKTDADTSQRSKKRLAVSSLNAEGFTTSIINAFSTKKRGSLASESYFVLTASADEEESYEGSIEGTVYGLFTYHIIEGLGYTSEEGHLDCPSIDDNENGVITIHEVYKYTRKKLISEGQHAQVYPENCLWFGILRDSNTNQ